MTSTSRTKHKPGDTLGQGTLVEIRGGGGGNGDVWRVESAKPPARALKILHRTSATDYERFQREVQICSKLDPEEFERLRPGETMTTAVASR